MLHAHVMCKCLINTISYYITHTIVGVSKVSDQLVQLTHGLPLVQQVRHRLLHIVTAQVKGQAHPHCGPWKRTPSHEPHKPVNRNRLGLQQLSTVQTTSHFLSLSYLRLLPPPSCFCMCVCVCVCSPITRMFQWNHNKTNSPTHLQLLNTLSFFFFKYFLMYMIIMVLFDFVFDLQSWDVSMVHVSLYCMSGLHRLFWDVCMFACALLLALDRLVYACFMYQFYVHSCFDL